MIKLSCLSVGLPRDLVNELKSVRPYELTFAAISNDVREAELLLESLIVQVVIIYSDEYDDNIVKFIDDLKASPSRPIICTIGNRPNDYEDIAHLALNSAKSAPDICNEILIMPLDKRDNLVDVKINRDRILDERLANIFISAGIPPHIKGYQFLREAVKQAVNDPGMINNITKMLYPAVAERFGTSPSKVERAIRHAIEVAWSRGKIENINNIYGIKIFSRGDKPTNGELIALVSDKLLIECS